MAESQRYLTIYMIVGTPVTGLWCEPCGLPSRVRFPIYRLSSHGVSLHCNVLRCTECQPSTEDD